MGSWYNLEGEALASCVTRNCGRIPVRPIGLIVTPQMTAEYNAKKEAWDFCRKRCGGMALLNGQITGRLNDTRPVQVGASDSVTDVANPAVKISPNMKIGLVVGAAVVIGLWFYFRKK